MGAQKTHVHACARIFLPSLCSHEHNTLTFPQLEQRAPNVQQLFVDTVMKVYSLLAIALCAVPVLTDAREHSNRALRSPTPAPGKGKGSPPVGKGKGEPSPTPAPTPGKGKGSPPVGKGKGSPPEGKGKGSRRE